MTRPTTLPQSWATNVNFAGGVNIGTPTKVAASAGRIADGWQNTNIPPAQEQNYWQNLIAQWAKYQADFIGEGDTATMVALVPTFDGAIFHLNAGSNGWYYWTTSPVATADDAFWIFDGTGGQWVNMLWNLAFSTGVAAVGVVPGLTGSAAGRIHKSLVPFGHVSSVLVGNATYSTTSATPVNVHTYDMTSITIVAGDSIRIIIPAIAAVLAGSDILGTVALHISYDGGSTYTSIAPGGSNPEYALNTTYGVAVALSAVVTAASNTGVKVAIFASVASSTVNVLTGPGSLEVLRP